MRTKRLVALFFALVCAFATGCGQAEVVSETTSAATDTTEQTETVLTDGLPDTDMGGFSMHLLNTSSESLTWADVRFLSEELDGEVVNDGLYNRQKDIEERFSCVLSQDEINCHEMAKQVGNLINAGDSTYQSFFVYEAKYGQTLPYCSDWNNIPYIQYTKEHWNPNATSVMQIDGKQTALAGNVSLSVVSRSVCMVFNKRIFDDIFTGESLYDQVYNNHWTLDTYLGYASAAGLDLNGDGAWTAADQYGLNMGRGFKGYIASFLGGSGYHFTTDEGGVPVFTMHTDENTLNLVQKLMDAMQQDGYYYNEDTTCHSFAPADFFSSGHALFTQGVPHDIYKLRDMEDDLGILPMPKLNEAQDSYYSASWGGHVLMLPKTVNPADTEGEYIGTILEAMSFAGYYDLLPLYKEVALKSKTARDEESAAMLDIIYASATFDFGTNILYDSVIATDVLQPLWDKKDSSSIVSTCTAKEKKIATYIDDVLTAVAEMQ